MMKPSLDRAVTSRSAANDDSSITKEYQGTGLGLAISQKIIRLMNGKIIAESLERQGSLFYFTIPLKLDKSIPEEQQNLFYAAS